MRAKALEITKCANTGRRGTNSIFLFFAHDPLTKTVPKNDFFLGRTWAGVGRSPRCRAFRPGLLTLTLLNMRDLVFAFSAPSRTPQKMRNVRPQTARPGSLRKAPGRPFEIHQSPQMGFLILFVLESVKKTNQAHELSTMTPQCASVATNLFVACWLPFFLPLPLVLSFFLLCLAFFLALVCAFFSFFCLPVLLSLARLDGFSGLQKEQVSRHAKVRDA